MRIHVHCLDEPLIPSGNRSGPRRALGAGPTVVTVTGEVDASAVPTIDECIVAALETASRTMILDLTRVDFLSIAGAQALERIQYSADRKGLTVLLVPGGRAVTRTLDVAGLLGHFRLFPTVRAALEKRRLELTAHTGLDIVVGPVSRHSCGSFARGRDNASRARHEPPV